MTLLGVQLESQTLLVHSLKIALLHLFPRMGGVDQLAIDRVHLADAMKETPPYSMTSVWSQCLQSFHYLDPLTLDDQTKRFKNQKLRR